MVPERLIRYDLLFIVERLASLLDEPRLAMLARQHGIREKRDDGGIAKTLAAYLRGADEGTLGRAVVESSILVAASPGNASQALREAATAYKVDTDAISTKVRQEFLARKRHGKRRHAVSKTQVIAAKRPARDLTSGAGLPNPEARISLLACPPHLRGDEGVSRAFLKESCHKSPNSYPMSFQKLGDVGC